MKKFGPRGDAKADFPLRHREVVLILRALREVSEYEQEDGNTEESERLNALRESLKRRLRHNEREDAARWRKEERRRGGVVLTEAQVETVFQNGKWVLLDLEER